MKLSTANIHNKQVQGYAVPQLLHQYHEQRVQRVDDMHCIGETSLRSGLYVEDDAGRSSALVFSALIMKSSI